MTVPKALPIRKGADGGPADHHHLKRQRLNDDVELTAGEGEPAKHHHKHDNDADNLKHNPTTRSGWTRLAGGFPLWDMPGPSDFGTVIGMGCLRLGLRAIRI
jgi:hypothetical protein